MLDDVIASLETRRNGELYNDFCLDDAIFHIKKAQEALDADPVTWYRDSIMCSRVIAKSLPLIVLLQLQESQAQNLASEENSQSEPTEDQSSVGSCQPESSPPR